MLESTTRRRHWLTLAAVPIAVLLARSPIALAQAANTPAERLAWMAGCWESRAPGRLVEEYWMRPNGGMLIGMSRTVVRDTLREHEALLIRRVGDRLVYDATPSGQKQTLFPAVYVTGDSAMFELPEHDFPQRIGYVRRGADSLVAWIEGTMNGKVRRIPYAYTRAECPRK